MLLSWDQALSLAILTLNITPIIAKNGSSIGSDIESGADGAFLAIEGGASQLVGDLENEFENYKQAVESELSKALVGNNGVLAQFTMEHQTTPPISTQLVTSGIQSNVTVGLYCESCSGSSQPSAFNFASQNFSGWNNSWLGFALDSFEASFEVDVELSAVANGELTLSLLKIPAAAEGVVVEVEFQLYLVANASATMSFTTGLNLTLTEPAAIMMPALDPVVKLNESERIGFDQDNFILAPIFNASMPQLDFSVQFSLRTVFSVTVEDINVGALYLDLPAFSLTANTLTNAMSNCQTPPAGTPSDEIYAELIQFNGALVATLSYEILDGGESGTIDTWTIWDALDDCYAFFPGLGSIGAVPASSNSPLLTAAAITTCTTGGTTTATGKAAVGAALKSLSPGAKAGAVIGTLVGVALITALAWYGGRASLRHSIKNGGTGSMWTMPRPRSGKFFSRSNRGGATEFSPVTQTTPDWQTTKYEGGVYPSPNTEAQQQFTHQSWQMAKKEPSVAVNQAATPAPTYVSIGDDYGMPTPEAGETERMKYNTGPRPAMNEGTRAGKADGLGLLQGAGPMLQRNGMQRKEVSRKSVPGHGNGSGSM